MIKVIEFDKEIKGHLVHMKCYYLFGKILLLRKAVLIDGFIAD